MSYIYCRFNHFLLQVEGDRRTSNGNNSRRPANMSNIRIYFEKSEYRSKFLVGPTSARPGPMFPTVEATAVKFVSRSRLSTLITRVDNANNIIYTMKKLLAERSTL